MSLAVSYALLYQDIYNLKEHHYYDVRPLHPGCVPEDDRFDEIKSGVYRFEGISIFDDMDSISDAGLAFSDSDHGSYYHFIPSEMYVIKEVSACK